MSFKRYVALGVLLIALPQVAGAQTSNFARDRNLPVAGRIPTGYVPLGVNTGAFTVFPLFGVNVSQNDNVYYANTDQKSDTIVTIAPQINVVSNWSRHQLQATIGANYSDYLTYSSEDTLNTNLAVGGRVDVHGNSNIFGGFSLSQNHEPRFSPSSPNAAAKPVKYDANVGDLGFVLEGNRLRLTGRADYSKFNYFDVRSKSGGMIDQDTRDYTLNVGTLRADYAISPDTSVYLIYAGNKRTYAESTVGRDSHGYDAAVGVSLDLTNLVSGELQYGYLQQTYKNAIYSKAKGPSYKALINYFPTRLTTISLKTARSVEETPVVGSSGYLSTNSSLSVDHELLRRLQLNASYTPGNDRYLGVDRRDKRQTAVIGAKYFLTPSVVVTANYTYMDLKSKGVAAITSYKDNAVNIALAYRY